VEYAIETRALSKRFGAVRAVADVSIRVKKGEIYGFLGLNGAGKTTTIRMLLGMIRPSAGVPYIKGKKADAANTRLWDSVGYLVEIPYAYPTLTVRENLELFRRRVLQIRTRNNKEAARELAAKGYPSAQGEDGDIEISDPRAVGNPEKINSFLVGKKLPPYLLKVDEEDLESYFLRVINENGGAA
jgi:ABC-type multidrug transport system ATPase subunit